MLKIYNIYTKTRVGTSFYDRYIGKVLCIGQNVIITEDLYGLLNEFNSYDDLLTKLNKNPYFKIEQVGFGENPEKILELSQNPISDISSWSYKGPGMEIGRKLEALDGQYYFDSNPIDNDLLTYILKTLQDGSAELSSLVELPNLPGIKKSFELFKKEEEQMQQTPEDILRHLQTLTQNGHISQEAIDTLRKHIFESQIIPGMGNMYAWKLHRSRPQEGVYASMDLNHLKHINDTYGHEAGTDAIKAFGQAAQNAAKAVGQENSKLFHVSGDEFTGHFRTPEHAYAFSRKLNQELNNIPKINQEHQISGSIGLGNDFDLADKSLYEAKKHKYVPEGVIKDSTGKIDSRASTAAFPKELTPNFIHSNISNQIGDVKL